MSKHDPAIHLVNDRALLISFSHRTDTLEVQRRLLMLAQQLRMESLRTPSAPEAPLRDIVPGPGSLMLELAPDTDLSLTMLTERLERYWSQLEDEPPAPSREVTIPVQYGGEHGPDLDTVARHSRLSPQEVIRRHAAGTYDVLCLGFQPGFPYLYGLDPRLATPRRTTPRPRVPAGAIAIGDDRTGIYPSPSPGGWQIIGRTTVTLFDATNTGQPTLLLPGDRIHFTVETRHV